jgi:hypothetical protein
LFLLLIEEKYSVIWIIQENYPGFIIIKNILCVTWRHAFLAQELNDAALYLLGRIHSTHLLLQLPPLRSTHTSQTDRVVFWYCELPALHSRHQLATPLTIGIVAACGYVLLEQPLYIWLPTNMKNNECTSLFGLVFSRIVSDSISAILLYMFPLIKSWFYS